MQTKVCSKCSKEKEISEFHISKIGGKYGVRPSCKVCHAKAAKEYRLNNKEKIAKIHKDYYLLNKEEIAKTSKDYYLQNKERIRKTHHKYRDRPDNKIKKSAQSKEYKRRRDVKERGANWYLLKHYGISLEEKRAMTENQDGKCAICNKVLDNGMHTHVDHNHNTGKIRGILCRKCNAGLGMFDDDLIIVKAATRYLKKYEESDE